MVPLTRTPLEYRGIYQLTTYYGKLGEVEFVYPETVGYATASCRSADMKRIYVDKPFRLRTSEACGNSAKARTPSTTPRRIIGP